MNVKLSRTSWLILTVGIFGITLGSLGVTHSQRVSESKRLSDELAVAQLRLSKLDLTGQMTQMETLQNKLRDTEAKLRENQIALTQPNDSISITDEVFQIAESCGVVITLTTSGALASSDIERVPAMMLPFDVTASGELTNLIDFITRLNEYFPTGEVKTSSIRNGSESGISAGAGSSDNVSAEGSDNIADLASDNLTPKFTARVQLPIYSYYSQGK